MKSDYNLVQGNRFREAGHDPWVIKCGNYNIVRSLFWLNWHGFLNRHRGNSIVNSVQKGSSVFDCEAPTMSWVGNGAFGQTTAILNSTKRNLVEDNTYTGFPPYYSSSGSNGIQYAGQAGIVRKNRFFCRSFCAIEWHDSFRFFNGMGTGIGLTLYADEALYNQHNRIYHNVFYKNWCGGMAISGQTGSVGNVIVNNIFYLNSGCLAASIAQLLYRTLNGFLVTKNNLRSNSTTTGIWCPFPLLKADIRSQGQQSFRMSLEAVLRLQVISPATRCSFPPITNCCHSSPMKLLLTSPSGQVCLNDFIWRDDTLQEVQW